MSSPSSSASSQDLGRPRFYSKDQMQVQQELLQTIDIQYLPDLQEVFQTAQWSFQDDPLDRTTLKKLYPKHPVTKEFVCVFCQNTSFSQSTKAVEHIQQHLGIFPFYCTGCNRVFRRKHELRGHARTHAAPDRIACSNDCGTYFTSDKVGNINRHLRESCSLRNAGVDE